MTGWTTVSPLRGVGTEMAIESSAVAGVVAETAAGLVELVRAIIAGFIGATTVFLSPCNGTTFGVSG